MSDSSRLSDSGSETSNSSAADIGDISNKFINKFYDVFGDSDDEEEELKGFQFKMPEGNVKTIS